VTRFFVVVLGFMLVIGIGGTLGTIVLRSPDTHSNLWNGVEPGYDRTPVDVVGEEVDFKLLGSVISDFDNPGRGLYLSAGCATCHGIDVGGGVVGARLAGSIPEITTNVVRQGNYGMPAFPEETLSEADLEMLVAYLESIPSFKPTNEERATLKLLTYDPSVSLERLLNGKATMRRSCAACHEVPDKAYLSGGYDVGELLEEMVKETNLSLEDARIIADYIFAIRNGADPIQAP
jgi:mono/diheme cytochrome c family protein